jgi:hypothetical protein
MRQDLLTEIKKKIEKITTSSKKPRWLVEDHLLEFQLSNNMKASECENVVLLAVTDFGTFGFPAFENTESPEKIGKAAAENLFSVWSNCDKVYFEHHPHLKEQCLRVVDLYQSVSAIETLQQGVKYLVCDDCGFTKEATTENDRAAFKKHVLKHKMDTSKCDCDIEFEDAKAKRIHMQLHHSKLKRVKCEFCDMVGSEHMIKKHIDFSHTIKNIVCDFCGRLCKKEADLVCHVRKVHKAFNCELCNETFIGAPRYTKHQEAEHQIKKTKYKPKVHYCDQCTFSCKGNFALQAHILSVHTPDQDKPHKCKDCGKSYGQLHHLVRHEKTCKPG